MSKPVTIDYYSDILCVWAWIAQRRIDELKVKLGDAIRLQHHYIDVFGDTVGKMQVQWAARGSFDGFAAHVAESAAPYEEAPVSPRIWSEVRPATSANAHLLLKAAEISHDEQSGSDLALALRKAFFTKAQDIGDFQVLLGLAATQGLQVDSLRGAIDDGTAMAALMADYQQGRALGLKGSPSYVLDGGRQTLYGNVGYRVLQANIEELLKRPEGEASWC